MQMLTFLGLLYVTAYGMAYSLRSPSANMAYFAYTGSAPELVEEALYYAFWPIYKLHRAMGCCNRHTWDRSPSQVEESSSDEAPKG